MRSAKEIKDAKGSIVANDYIDYVLRNGKGSQIAKGLTDAMASGGNPYRFLREVRKHYKRKNGLTLSARLAQAQKDKNLLKRNGYDM